MISNFYQNYFKNNYKLPELMEYKFEVEIKNPESKNEILTLFGIMDRIDINNGKLEIIDYKTGNTKTQKEVDSDFQMSFYALAASLIKEKIFNVKPEDISLTLYYLDSGERITTRRTARQLENIKKKIFNIKNQIENSDFKCTNGILCQNCEFKMLCKAESD
jgi:RecB family exonuclease